MFKKHTICRACGNTELTPVFDLGLQFPANDFKSANEERMGAAPLEVLFCEKCTLAQLSVVVDPNLLYANYPYVTSTSDQIRHHFKELADVLDINGKTMIEIGSNDGAFLEYCWENGAVDMVGIDPAENLENPKNSFPTVFGLFSKPTATEAMHLLNGKKPDIIIARHCFAHINDWKEFVKVLGIVCGPDTAVVIEVPYVMDTLEKCEFDQVYHEHLSFVSLRAMDAMLTDTPFKMVDAKHFNVHGGAIAIFIKRRANNPDLFCYDENIALDHWRTFSYKAHERIASLCMEVKEWVNEGRKVVGFGASAKSSVWIQSCRFTNEHLRFICDNTPFKQGRLSPGTDIPIVPESELTRENADIAINFAWQYHEEIVKKHQTWVGAGGVFINPHML